MVLSSEGHLLLFYDFLTRWPTLLSAKRARKATLEAFFYAHNGRRATLIRGAFGVNSVQAISRSQKMPALSRPCSLTPSRWWSNYAPSSR